MSNKKSVEEAIQQLALEYEGLSEDMKTYIAANIWARSASKVNASLLSVTDKEEIMAMRPPIIFSLMESYFREKTQADLIREEIKGKIGGVAIAAEKMKHAIGAVVEGIEDINIRTLETPGARIKREKKRAKKGKKRAKEQAELIKMLAKGLGTTPDKFKEVFDHARGLCE